MPPTISLSSLIINGKNEEAKRIIGIQNCFNSKNMLNETWLHIAAKSGNQEITKFLLDGRSQVDAQNSSGMTPLMEALEKQHEKIVQILLTEGANVFINFKSGRNLLNSFFEWPEKKRRILDVIVQHFHCKYGKAENLAEILIENKCQIDQALMFKDSKILEYMIKKGHSPNYTQNYKDQHTILHLAVLILDVKNVELLLEYGVNMNATNRWGKTPAYYLYYTAQDRDNPNQIEILKLLLKKGLSPMSFCESEDCFEIKHTLLFGPREAISLLLQSNKLDFETKDVDGHTVLHYLAQNHKSGIADELETFEVMLNVNICDNQGRNPVYFALQYSNFEMLEYLLNKIDSGPILVQPTNAYHIKDIFDFSLERRIERLKPVVAHVALLQKLEKPISEEVSLKINSQKAFKKYFDLCHKMLDLIVTDDLTVFQLLAANEKTMTKYLKKGEFPPNYAKKLKPSYLYYYNILKKRIEKGFLYNELKNQATVTISQLLKNRCDETNLIVENIIYYLHMKDLQVLSHIYN